MGFANSWYHNNSTCFFLVRIFSKPIPIEQLVSSRSCASVEDSNVFHCSFGTEVELIKEKFSFVRKGTIYQFWRQREQFRLRSI